MSRSTLFTASQPSQHLSPYAPRPPPSPPGAALLASLSRSSSLRSGKAPTPAREHRSSSPPDQQPTQADIETPQSTMQAPTGYSTRPSSLKPRPLPSPLYPRRRSWFREEDPSAFGPPSPDPAALSPMATFRSSMSEDEQRDELFSQTSSSSAESRSPASLYSLSLSPHHPSQNHDTTKQPQQEQAQVEAQEKGKEEFRPFSHVNESTFQSLSLSFPSRSRSDSARSHRSNPCVIINPACDYSNNYSSNTDIPRRASEGTNHKTTPNPNSRVLYYDTRCERGGPGAGAGAGGSAGGSRGAWERSFARTRS